MKHKQKPNDHKMITPKTKGRNRAEDGKLTNNNTLKKETSSPQKVREQNEPEAEQARLNRAKGKQ